MKKLSLIIMVIAAAILAGCGGKEDPGKTNPKNGGGKAAALPSGLVVAELSGEALTPIKARATVKVGDEVLLSGNIAGSKKPMVEGRAMFTRVGGELLTCDENCGTCPTPWDLCCETPEDIVKNAVTIQVVDKDGKPLKASLKDHQGLAYNARILVKGTVQQMDESVFIVNATQFAIRKVEKKTPKKTD